MCDKTWDDFKLYFFICYHRMRSVISTFEWCIKYHPYNKVGLLLDNKVVLKYRLCLIDTSVLISADYTCSVSIPLMKYEINIWNMKSHFMTLICFLFKFFHFIHAIYGIKIWICNCWCDDIPQTMNSREESVIRIGF